MPTSKQTMVAKGHTFISHGRVKVNEFSPVTVEMIPGGWELEDLIENGTLVEVDVFSPTKEKEEEVPVSPWLHDPAKLQKMSLDKMNLMIADINAEYGPYETVEEAVAQLSRDLKKAD